MSDDNIVYVLVALFVAQFLYAIYCKKQLPDVPVHALQTQAVGQQTRDFENETCIYRCKEVYFDYNSQSYNLFYKDHKFVTSLPELSSLSAISNFLSDEAKVKVAKIRSFLRKHKVKSVGFMVKQHDYNMLLVQVGCYAVDSSIYFSKFDNLDLLVSDNFENAKSSYKLGINLSETSLPNKNIKNMSDVYLMSESCENLVGKPEFNFQNGTLSHDAYLAATSNTFIIYLI
jgi:hypothetical protein